MRELREELAALQARSGTVSAKLAQSGQRISHAHSRAAAAEAILMEYENYDTELRAELASESEALRSRSKDVSEQILTLQHTLASLREHCEAVASTMGGDWEEGHGEFALLAKHECEQFVEKTREAERVNEVRASEIVALKEAASALLDGSTRHTCSIEKLRAANRSLEEQACSIAADVQQMRERYWDTMPFRVASYDIHEAERLQECYTENSAEVGALEGKLREAQRAAEVASSEAAAAAALRMAVAVAAETAQEHDYPASSVSSPRSVMLEEARPQAVLVAAPLSSKPGVTAGCGLYGSSAYWGSLPPRSSDSAPSLPCFSPAHSDLQGTNVSSIKFVDSIDAVTLESASRESELQVTPRGSPVVRREHLLKAPSAVPREISTGMPQEHGSAAKTPCSTSSKDISLNDALRDMDQAQELAEVEVRNLGLRQEIAAMREQLEQRRLRQEIKAMKSQVKLRGTGRPSPGAMPSLGPLAGTGSPAPQAPDLGSRARAFGEGSRGDPLSAASPLRGVAGEEPLSRVTISPSSVQQQSFSGTAYVMATAAAVAAATGATTQLVPKSTRSTLEPAESSALLSTSGEGRSRWFWPLALDGSEGQPEAPHSRRFGANDRRRLPPAPEPAAALPPRHGAGHHSLVP